MLSYRTYALMISAAAGATMAAVLAFALWLEPLRGDLTRLGGHAENHYAWRAPQQVFQPPLAMPPDGTGPLDVVVFGDSFSWRSAADHQTPVGAFWPDHLAAISGWRVGVAGRVEDLAATLATARFAIHPPRAIVVQVTERFLPRLANTPDCRQRPPPTQSPSTLPAAVAGPEPVPWVFSATQWNLDRRISVASDFLRKALQRALMPWITSPAPRVALTRDDLFSSAAPGTLLHLADDHAKRGTTPAQIARIACRLRELRAAAAGLDGAPQVVLMIVPDKSTAYAEFMPSTAGAPNLTAPLAAEADLALLRLDIPLAAAVRQGTRDVYLPNDTHWGSAGARLVAQAVRARLTGAAP